MMDKKKQGKRKHSEKNCFNCTHCIYIEEGDYICDMVNEPIITDFVIPWEAFYQCNGKDFESV